MDELDKKLTEELKQSGAIEASKRINALEYATDLQKSINEKREILRSLPQDIQDSLGDTFLSTNYRQTLTKTFKKQASFQPESAEYKELASHVNSLQKLAQINQNLKYQYITFLSRKSRLGDDLTEQEKNIYMQTDDSPSSFATITLDYASKSAKSFTQSITQKLPTPKREDYEANKDNFDLLVGFQLKLKEKLSQEERVEVKSRFDKFLDSKSKFCQLSDAEKIIDNIKQFEIARPYVKKFEEIEGDLDEYIASREQISEKTGKTTDEKSQITADFKAKLTKLKEAVAIAASKEKIKELISKFSTEITEAIEKLNKQHKAGFFRSFRTSKPRVIETLENMRGLDGATVIQEGPKQRV